MLRDEHVFRQALRSQIKQVWSDMAAAKGPGERADLAGVVRGVQMAELLLDAVATFHAVNRQEVA